MFMNVNISEWDYLWSASHGPVKYCKRYVETLGGAVSHANGLYLHANKP